MASYPYNLSGAGYNLYSGVVGIFGQDNVIITSGGRTAASNASIPGASSTSQHMHGDAIDFVVPGMTSAEVAQAVANSGMEYGQLIGYTGDRHVHIGAGTKGQDLLKTAKGYISTTWKSATGKLKGKLTGEAVKAAASAIPGGTIAVGIADKLGFGIGGDECGWFCQIKKWFSCEEEGDTCFFQRAGLVILAMILIFAAFYLLGTGQVQKMVKSIS